MSNVLYVITSLSVGGAQKALLNLVTSSISEEYKPFVLALRPVDGIRSQFEQAGIPVYELQLNRLQGLSGAPVQLWRLVREIRPDIIHGWMHHGNLLAVLAWLFAGCKPMLLWGMHHTPEAATSERLQHALVLRLGQWLSRFPDNILYVSRRSQQRHREMGYASGRSLVVANGIAVRSGVADGTRAEVRAELGIDDATPVIGSLTRYVPEKDIPNLVEAIRLFLLAGNKACFVLAGERMGADNPELVALLKTAGCQENVRLLGVRKDAGRLIAAMDLATLSSRREAFPLFLAEAMAAGVPCVATDVGDIAEFVGSTGLVVPRESPAQLAAAWAQLLGLSGTERQQLGQVAQTRIRDTYSLDTVVSLYQSIFRGKPLTSSQNS
ncbi:MAG: glycosyltransferase [Gammaproteobacteria bacterium]|nr:glycosyltransferase [Gammaproteobacteria bacterium]MBU1724505.1 glycosyltransferase [Gammaproteobacteria bacterium]MBU2004548.1 glycosyltransferase [Gammaproteobacteria bacterium]